MDSAHLELRGLGFSYGHAPLFEGLNLTLEPGLLHGVVGPNGSGKTTLLGLLAGQLSPHRGEVLLGGVPVTSQGVAERARRCALVEQNPDFHFPFTVSETVLMGRHPHIPRFSRPSVLDRALVERALEAMNLTGLRDRVLFELSGGERQRTAMARGLAQDTPVLLADEPTSAMDIRHALTTMETLHDLALKKQHTVVAVLHDLNLAARFCDRILMLDIGRVHAYGNVAQTLTPKNIRAVFGVDIEVLVTRSGPQLVYA